MKFKTKYIEIIYLIVLFIILLNFGFSGPFGGKISHPYPQGYQASDSYWALAYSEQTKDMGGFIQRPFYNAMGRDDVSTCIPPLLYHTVSFFSINTGINLYDIQQFIPFLLFIFSAFIFYIMLRRISITLALISSPIFLFLLTQTNYIVLLWGKHNTIFGGFYLISFYLSLLFFDSKPSIKRGIVMGVLLSALFMSHPSEFIFAIGFLVLYILVKLYENLRSKEKVENFNLIKNLVAVSITFIILSGYYLFVFLNTLWKSNSDEVTSNLFKVITSPGYPFFSIKEFGFFSIFIYVGIILSLYLLLKTKEKGLKLVIMMSLYSLFLGYTNYIGWAQRSFQQRYFWPVYLSFFCGIGIYWLLGRLKIEKNMIIAVGLSTVFLIIILLFYLVLLSIGGTAIPQHWETYKWIEKNTAKEDKILFLYGDTYDQNAQLMAMKRIPYLINYDDYFNSIISKEIKRKYLIRELANGDCYMPYKKSIFTWGYYDLEENTSQTIPRDLCNFDYYVMDMLGQNQYGILLNQKIAQILTSNDWIGMAYKNELVLVLKNTKKGEKCMEDGLKWE